MRHGFDGYNPIGLGLFSLIEAADLWVKPHGKVGRLHKGPGQILIPILGIAAPFAFAVAQLFAPYSATVRSEVPDTGKSADLASL